MIIYRNTKAKEGEIETITAERDRQNGKTFYVAQCTYVEEWTAPNGDKGRLKSLGMITDSPTIVFKGQPLTTVQYFENKIQEIKHERVII